MLRLRGSLSCGSDPSENGEPEINMAPLIDMVFILLIFFLVTTSFVREAGVRVERPTAATASSQKKEAMMVGVTDNGDLYIDRRQADLRSVRGLVEQFLATNPSGSVVIVADKESKTGLVIQVVDQARLAGARDVAVAAKRPAH
ncbi:biopolymer transporter ExbD [Desulfocarbo indianensis]|nr:biopolymer transporter ExbD [Desulfocarbo indianensis]